jgi:uncharacterized protein YecE (DUF72 family)
MSELHIGTCSWKYKSWRGLVYPETGEFDFLEEYSKRFNTVEIDQWFWSLMTGGELLMPEPADAEDYGRSVPDGFRFTIKAPNSITLTHGFRKGNEEPLLVNPHFLSPELYVDFLARLQPLGEKIGAVMLQFGYLNRQKMATQQAFLDKLASFLTAVPRSVRLAIELRNPAYLDENYFTLLRRHGVIHVYCQGYYLPPIWETDKKFGGLLDDTVIIRLLGRDRKGMEDRSGDRWDRVLEPKDDELAHIVSMVARLRKRGKRVYININNHYEGSAPLTAQKIIAGLKTRTKTREP